MILVLLGTNPYSFSRLIEAVDCYAANTGEKIIIQLGYSTSQPKNLRFFDFKSHDEILTLIQSADLIIAHGGYGTIYDCLVQKKKVIAVPRKRELNEALDFGLGQLELVQYLERKNRVIGLYDVEDIAMKIEEAKAFCPDFKFTNELPQLISDILKKTVV